MLELKNISFEVEEKKGQKEIIHQLDLSIGDGEFVVVTGPNGGGKSTLAKLIAGIEKPSSGSIWFDGEDITEKTARFEEVNLILRKLGHACGYLLLSAAVMAALSQFSLPLKRRLWIALLICVFCACCDEFHQLFVDGRTGQLLDVFWDSCGTIIGLEYSCLVILKHQERKRNVKNEKIIA